IMASNLDPNGLSQAATGATARDEVAVSQPMVTEASRSYSTVETAPITPSVDTSSLEDTAAPARSDSGLRLATASSLVSSVTTNASSAIPAPATPFVWLALAISVWMFAVRPSRTGLRNRSMSTT
ncbi:MAG: hypothetical protein M3092_08925, partial [Actinomycetia bacterium]|nr:hypothetical protein [Actinomycetes bacterium]